jgi:hypothetical protein
MLRGLDVALRGLVYPSCMWYLGVPGMSTRNAYGILAISNLVIELDFNFIV